ncbi:MAG: DUF1295 domain-containing protein [Candidatus Lokiarchaeota archaeon]|nr:DUF1295 domain-containing protein [Candidatus Lokiarchaeota archaeon]
MIEEIIYYAIGIIFLIFGAVTFITLMFKTASYGRHTKKGLDYILAWTIMEAVPLFVYLIFYFIGDRLLNPVAIVFMILFCGHYVQRAFIFPFLTRGKEFIPWTIMTTAIIFNATNGYLISRWNNYFGPVLSPTWFTSPQFIVGIIIFTIGMTINLHSDHILRNLRSPGETEYKIPKGGVFKYVSCGNYFGEIVEWWGYAILTCSFGALVFALWVMANLLPRAISHHKWYKKKFPDYPEERKAIFPFIL